MLNTLANRVAALGYFKCPMCGDGDFDIGGFLLGHLEGPNGCPVNWHFDGGTNADLAAKLRALAIQEKNDD